MSQNKIDRAKQLISTFVPDHELESIDYLNYSDLNYSPNRGSQKKQNWVIEMILKSIFYSNK